MIREHTRSQPRSSPISCIRGREDPDSSSSSSNDSQRNYHSEHRGTGFLSSDDESQLAIVPFHQRSKGPSHRRLASLQPSNKKYQRLMSYRYYRLRKTTHTRDHARTTQLHKLLKNLDLSFRESKFSGQDPILIFNFLTRMVEECDTLGMSEAQAFMALPHLLSDNARTQFRAMQSGSRTSGVTCWPEGVQYILRTYATPAAIRNATNELPSIRQSADEDELPFGGRMNHAVYRCGNIYEEDQKMIFFIDGLRPETMTLVARFCKNQYRQDLMFVRLIQLAKYEGLSFRAIAPRRVTTRPSDGNRKL